MAAARGVSYAETIINEIFVVLAGLYGPQQNMYDPRPKLISWEDGTDMQREAIITDLLTTLKSKKKELELEGSSEAKCYPELIDFLEKMKPVAAERELFREFDNIGIYGLHKYIIFFIFPFEKELLNNFDRYTNAPYIMNGHIINLGYGDVIRVQDINRTIRSYNDRHVMDSIHYKWAFPFLNIARHVRDKLENELNRDQHYVLSHDTYGDKRVADQELYAKAVADEDSMANRGGRRTHRRTHRKRAHKRTHRKRKH